MADYLSQPLFFSKVTVNRLWRLALSVCRQLWKSACRALAKMWCDPEVHHDMLEKACMDGDVAMAECLIELGADVNRKPKNESLFYQVRRKWCTVTDKGKLRSNDSAHISGVWERRTLGAGGAPAESRRPRAAPPQGPGCEREKGRRAHGHPAARPAGFGPEQQRALPGGLKAGPAGRLLAEPPAGWTRQNSQSKLQQWAGIVDLICLFHFLWLIISEVFHRSCCGSNLGLPCFLFPR